MRKRVFVFVAVFFLLTFLSVGWKKEDDDSDLGAFGQKIFLIDATQAEYENVYLKHFNKYYTLDNSISYTNAEKYGIGINGNEVYHWFGSGTVLTVDDFAPLRAKTHDKIVSREGEIEFVPMEFVQYSIMAYQGLPGTGLYYWDYDAGYDKMAFPRQACVVYNASDRSIRYDQIEKGESYTLRWNDLYGYNAIEMPPANSRLYTKTGDAVEVPASKSSSECVEYSISDFEPGTYAVVTRNKYGPKFGGLVTIE